MGDMTGKDISEAVFNMWRADMGRARTEGYAAGLEAAAQEADKWHGLFQPQALARTIRALKEKPKP